MNIYAGSIIKCVSVAFKPQILNEHETSGIALLFSVSGYKRGYRKKNR